jgi:Leucine-rich repeat (LRR) protein
VLDLSSNILQTLPQSITALTGLTIFRINHNRIVALPDSIYKLNGLKVVQDKKTYTTLDLSENELCAPAPKAAEWATEFDPKWRETQKCKK